MNSHDSGVSISDKNRLTAGQVLAERREKLGLTIEECAETLKLSVSKMKALEDDDDGPFPSEVFLRGYLKSYAKLVDLPESDVLYYYDSQRQAFNVRVEKAASEESDRSNKKWWLPYILAGFVVLAWFMASNDIGLGEYWPSSEPSIEQQSEDVESSITPLSTDELVNPVLGGMQSLPLSEALSDDVQQLSDDLPTGTESVEGVKPDALDLLEQQKPLLSPNVDGGRSSISAPVDVPISEKVIDEAGDQEDSVLRSNTLESKEESQVNATSEFVNPIVLEAELVLPEALSSNTSLVNDLLHFTFLEACWVEVIDATNKTIVSSIRQANSELLVEGRSPFSVVMGNVNGATLHFNDKQVDLANSADGRTLRLTVGG